MGGHGRYSLNARRCQPCRAPRRFARYRRLCVSLASHRLRIVERPGESFRRAKSLESHACLDSRRRPSHERSLQNGTFCSPRFDSCLVGFPRPGVILFGCSRNHLSPLHERPASHSESSHCGLLRFSSHRSWRNHLYNSGSRSASEVKTDHRKRRISCPTQFQGGRLFQQEP